MTKHLGCRKGTLARQIDLIWSASMAKICAAVDKQNGGDARGPCRASNTLCDVGRAGLIPHARRRGARGSTGYALAEVPSLPKALLQV